MTDRYRRPLSVRLLGLSMLLLFGIIAALLYQSESVVTPALSVSEEAILKELANAPPLSLVVFKEQKQKSHALTLVCGKDKETGLAILTTMSRQGVGHCDSLTGYATRIAVPHISHVIPSGTESHRIALEVYIADLVGHEEWKKEQEKK